MSAVDFYDCTSGTPEKVGQITEGDDGLECEPDEDWLQEIANTPIFANGEGITPDDDDFLENLHRYYHGSMFYATTAHESENMAIDTEQDKNTVMLAGKEPPDPEVEQDLGLLEDDDDEKEPRPAGDDSGGAAFVMGRFEEGKHPRGQPKNPGQFVEKGQQRAKKAEKPSGKKSEKTLKKQGKTKGPKPQPINERAERAKKSRKLITADIRRMADEADLKLAKMLGAVKTPDNHPMDSIRGRNGFEAKTFFNNDNAKVTMHKECRYRKLVWMCQKARRESHIVLQDKRDVLNPHQYSGHLFYYRRGLGSPRAGAMYAAKDIDEINKLIRMPADKLPKKAKPTKQRVTEIGIKDFDPSNRTHCKKLHAFALKHGIIGKSKVNK